jgi:hypothetical protein
MVTRLNALLNDRRGVSAVEFAFVAPILLSVAMGMIELARFALLTIKLQHASSTLADLATRDQTLSAATLDSLFSAARHILEPFDITSNGRAIVTGFGQPAGQSARIFWQRAGAGSYAAASELGSAGGSPVKPDDLVLREGDTIVAAEVYFRYEPWLLGFVPEMKLRPVAFYRPRFGSLTTLQ